MTPHALHDRLTTDLGLPGRRGRRRSTRELSTEVGCVATDEAEKSPFPEPLDALNGVYADPAKAERLWFREGASSKEHYERAEGWGTYQSDQAPVRTGREGD